MLAARLGGNGRAGPSCVLRRPDARAARRCRAGCTAAARGRPGRRGPRSAAHAERASGPEHRDAGSSAQHRYEELLEKLLVADPQELEQVAQAEPDIMSFNFLVWLSERGSEVKNNGRLDNICAWLVGSREGISTLPTSLQDAALAANPAFSAENNQLAERKVEALREDMMAAKVQAATELLGRQRLPQESLDAVFAAMAAADAANRIVDVLLEEHGDAARLSLLTDALTPPSVMDREVGLLKDDDEEMLFTSPLRLLQALNLKAAQLQDTTGQDTEEGHKFIRLQQVRDAVLQDWLHEVPG